MSLMAQTFLNFSLLMTLVTLISSVTSILAKDYDYFYLSPQWPPSSCATEGTNCVLERAKNTNFTIHGLWPWKTHHGPVEYCDGKEYRKEMKTLGNGTMDSTGLFLNGALHWESENKKDGSRKIIAFDLGKEKFYDVPLPLSSPSYKYYRIGVVGEYLFVSFFPTCPQGPENIVWVMMEYCNEASWVHLISYIPVKISDDAVYVSNSVPITSVNEGGYIWLRYFGGFVDVLEWIDNNPDGGSDEAEEQYSKKGLNKFYRNNNLMGIPSQKL
ncbi:hypothetical protein Tsubulata_029504 [Turnera subulata]|uniref:F-box associated beta-propeller type 1 domain-containing protein n=1 Tax=Turnera subulata TaxID=218843 RepID=A0A9Q0G0B8_9ROSI|nr:hypothetical protein Tsubulata_029504 [Turnera subulata]